MTIVRISLCHGVLSSHSITLFKVCVRFPNLPPLRRGTTMAIAKYTDKYNWWVTYFSWYFCCYSDIQFVHKRTNWTMYCTQCLFKYSYPDGCMYPTCRKKPQHGSHSHWKWLATRLYFCWYILNNILISLRNNPATWTPQRVSLLPIVYVGFCVEL